MSVSFNRKTRAQVLQKLNVGDFSLDFPHWKLGIPWNYPNRYFVKILGAENGPYCGGSFWKVLESRTELWVFPTPSLWEPLNVADSQGSPVMTPLLGSHLQLPCGRITHRLMQNGFSLRPSSLAPSLPEGERGGCERKSKHTSTSFQAQPPAHT